MKKHTTKALRIVSLLVATFALNQAQAAPIAYPAKGQSQAKQQSDDGECYVWAKSNTGIDPAAVATAPAQPAAPTTAGGERVSGALRGAAVGAIVDGGDGAAKGAGVGVVAGGARAQKNKQTQQTQQQASAQSSKQASIDTFYRAHSACMEARGYTVK
jgi:hypothetical protein